MEINIDLGDQAIDNTDVTDKTNYNSGINTSHFTVAYTNGRDIKTADFKTG